MYNTNAIFSPFGWGEPCLRDFECFIAGAALIKPDMDHLQSWPELYKKNETYLAFPWEMEKWKENIPRILEDKELLYKLAVNGHHAYRKLWTKEGRDEFCRRFINMITPD